MQDIVVLIGLELGIRVLKGILKHAEISDALTHDRLADGFARFRVVLHLVQDFCSVLEPFVEKSRKVRGELGWIVLQHSEPLGEVGRRFFKVLEGEESIDKGLGVKGFVSWLI